jgi:hypothetical protein
MKLKGKRASGSLRATGGENCAEATLNKKRLKTENFG